MLTEPQFHGPVETAILGAVTTAGSPLHIHKVLPPFELEFEVRDCRSHAVVANAVFTAKLRGPDGVEVAWPTAAGNGLPDQPPAWDLVAHPWIPVGKKGEPVPAKGYGGNDWSKLGAALAALGHQAPTGAKYTPALRDAANDFQLVQGSVDANAADDHRVAPAWVQQIVAEYNKRFLDMVQYQLTVHGFPCDADAAGTWGAASEEAFDRWQEIIVKEARASHRFRTFNGIKNATRRAELIQKLQEEVHFKTDAAGVARVPVPLKMVREGCTIRVEFERFAVVIDRPGLTAEGQPAMVEWAPTQDEPSGTWGWRVRPPGSHGPTASLTDEFRAFLKINLPAASLYDWRRLSEAEQAVAHFVTEPPTQHRRARVRLLALQWCQPVWDAFDDPVAPYVVGKDSVMQDPQGIRGRHMHIVTRAVQFGKQPNHHGTRGYGLLDHVNTAAQATYRNQEHGHGGLDVHVVTGDPVFAVHYGRVERKTQFKKKKNELGKLEFVLDADGNKIIIGGGHYVSLHFLDRRDELWYFHLQESRRAKQEPVRPGKILGYAGRTGNLDGETYNPGHTHLQRYVGGPGDSADIGSVFLLATYPDAANQSVIPTNETVPLLLPCRSEMRTADVSQNHCRFMDGAFTANCWAVGELSCPYMAYTNHRSVFRIQAQLRYISEQRNDPSLDPGAVDGKRRPHLSNAVKAFRVLEQLPPGDTMDADLVRHLDRLAPLKVPDEAPGDVVVFLDL